MQKNLKKYFWLALGAMVTFVCFTVAVATVDRQPIGPQGSVVGLATLNQWAHNAMGVCMPLYTLTDWLSLIPLGCVAGFSLLGFAQWLGRKSLKKVDKSLWVLGGFYLLVLAAFWGFEQAAVHFRPVLIAGVLEASYPSSTTLLTLCVMPTTIDQLRRRVRWQGLKKGLTVALWAFTGFMVVGRLLSGVHWLTDIIGGTLLSIALVALYHLGVEPKEK